MGNSDQVTSLPHVSSPPHISTPVLQNHSEKSTQSPLPATSLHAKSKPNIDPFFASNDAERNIRKHRSMERIDESASELTNARSRLRSVAEKKESASKPPEAQAYSIDDLGNMLDTAIEEHGGTPEGPVIVELSPEVPKHSTAVRRWHSARTPRKFIDHVQESFLPTKRLSGYDAEGVATWTKHSLESASPPSRNQTLHHPTPTRPRRPVSKLESHALRHNDASLAMPQSLRNVKEPSPVKQRTEMFDFTNQGRALEKREASHKGHLHVKKNWSVIPPHLPTEEQEKELHNLKFGQTIYDGGGMSTSPPDIAQIVHQAPYSRASLTETEENYDTALQSHRPSQTSTISRTGSKSSHARKTSLSWPFKWRMFSKGSAAPPQENPDDARADSKRDEHYPASRPSVVKSKVQELLDAAGNREQEDQSRRQSEARYLSRRQSRNSGRVTEIQINPDVPSASEIDAHHSSAVQLPVKDQAAVFDSTVQELGTLELDQEKATIEAPVLSLDTPQTPALHSLHEKEVMPDNSPTVSYPTPRGPSVRSMSPVKTLAESQPDTPRGRRSVARQSLSPRRPTHAVEQRYILESNSRSPSRGSRIRLELELHDSPEEAARDRGDKVLVMRADVEAMDEIDEGVAGRRLNESWLSEA